MPNRTPLYEEHKKLGAKFTEFCGWEMPVWYSGIVEEHMAVRKEVGVFDVSHMGRVEVSEEYEEELSRLFTKDLRGSKDYKLKYGMMLNPDGSVIDDMIIYKLPGKFLIVPNAGNDQIIASWINKNLGKDVAKVVTEELAMLAVQGPKAQETMEKATGEELSDLKFFRAKEISLFGKKGIISRSGYTGEDGFEIIAPPEAIISLWKKLMELGVKPCGLGARDTLRLEMGFPLAGNEFSGGRTPIEAGLEFAIDWDHEFIGREALQRLKERGDYERLVGIVLDSKAPPRHGYEVYKGEERIGTVSSGGYSPVLQRGIALAYVKPEHSSEGEEVGIKIRGKIIRGKIVKPPFVKRR